MAMDIRKFFGATPVKKDKPPEKCEPELTKIKNGKDRHEQKSAHIDLTEVMDVDDFQDENGNRKTSKKKQDSKGKPKQEKRQSLDKDKTKDVKHNRKEKEKHKDEEKKRKKNDNNAKKQLESSTSEKDEIDGETVMEKSKGKKRKLEVSSDEDVIAVHDNIQDNDDDEVVVKKSKLKKKGKKKPKLFDSDEDEDPISKEKKPRKSRKIVHIGGLDGYTEEEIPEAKPKKTFMDNFLVGKSPQKDKGTAKPEPTKKPAEAKPTVSASAFFGDASIHRVERKVVPAKKPEEEDTIDLEMHSDDDFERTLELIDEEELTGLKKIDSKASSDKPSLSSKLACKVKQQGAESPEKKPLVLAADTPVSKQVNGRTPVSKQPSPKKAKMEFVMNRHERKAETSVSKKTPEKKSLEKKTPEKKVSPAKPGSEKKTSPVKHESDGFTPKGGGAGYRAYLNRTGPQALGSKEIPEGADNCLEGLTFVITGVLDSFERDEAKTAVERYGGKVTGNVSKKTDYLVAGRDPGQSKMTKAESVKTKIIDENGLLDLIRTRPGKKSKYTLQAEVSVKKEMLESKPSTSEKLSSFKKEQQTPSKSFSSFSAKDNQSVSSNQSDSRVSKSNQSDSSISNSNQAESRNKTKTDPTEPALLWVDKYKPTQLKQIIGQTGDKSNAKKLLQWLTNWHKGQAAGIKPVTTGKFFGGKGGSETGAGFKAALLSGPPGIGKTTTATLVCQEAGFSYVELNASDTRNAKSLKEVISQSVGNTSIVDFMGSGVSSTHGQKHCLVMDEVDGMSGNEDRGGVQELVSIIKATKIPIITMCNDRNHPKMRTLANYCFDLRFQRPRVEQIKAAVMSIAFKEGLNVPPPAVNEIIVAANQDIRQVIHNLSMWTASSKAITYDQVKSDAQHAKKDFKLGPFDVCRKVFVGGEETNKMTLNDKSDLFFHDYNIAPLFVQENYIHVIPYAANGNNHRHLSLLARTADSISCGDMVERRIRTQQSWGLLSLEAMYGSVIPGEYMRGNITQMIAFPGWLGKNSTTGKTERILQELRTHMRLQISGDKRSLNMDYLPFLRHSLTEPLVKREAEGVKEVIDLMDEYDIIKDDFDNILEITKWPNSKDPLSLLSAKTKAAFTRTYNKEVHMTPYSTGTFTKTRRGGGGADLAPDLLGEGEGEELEEEEEDGDDLETDTMIKKKTDSKAKAEPKGKGKALAKGKAEPKGKRKGKR